MDVDLQALRRFASAQVSVREACVRGCGAAALERTIAATTVVVLDASLTPNKPSHIIAKSSPRLLTPQRWTHQRCAGCRLCRRNSTPTAMVSAAGASVSVSSSLKLPGNGHGLLVAAVDTSASSSNNSVVVLGAVPTGDASSVANAAGE